MRDLQREVGKELQSSKIGPERMNAATREIAAHLEDLEAEFIANGMSPKDAASAAWAQFDWRQLRKELVMLERTERIRKVWMPALISTAGFIGFLFLFGRQTIYWQWHGMLFFFTWPYTLALLPLGAVAAWWSRREGASPKERLIAAAFPGLAWLAVLLFVMLSAIFIDHILQHPERLAAAGIGVLLWGISPCVALLLGALPFLRQSADSSWRELRTTRS